MNVKIKGINKITNIEKASPVILFIIFKLKFFFCVRIDFQNSILMFLSLTSIFQELASCGIKVNSPRRVLNLPQIALLEQARTRQALDSKTLQVIMHCKS